jgi:hypothetical protein
MLGTSMGTGKMEIKDDFDLGAALVTFEITDTTPVTEYDQIQNFSAGNSINITNAKMHLDWGTYVPVSGDKFKVIDGSGGVTGTFSAVTSSNPSIQYTVNYTTDEVEVEITGGSTGSDSVDITFSVNTSWITVDPAGLFLAGGGNFGNPGDNPMSDSDGDGVWEITVRQPKGFSSHYTFTNGNCPGWTCKEDIMGQSCADPNNFNDRFLPGVWSDTTLTTCFGWCSDDGSCPMPLDTFNVTFQVDMNTQTIDPAGVFLAGSFEGWQKSIVMSDNDADGVYDVTVPLTAGDYEYKFVNGDWPTAEEFDPGTSDSLCTITDPSGQFTNRLVSVTGDSTLYVYCYDSCFTCDGFNVFTTQLQIDDKLFSIRPNITRDYTNIVFAENAVMEEKLIRIYNTYGQLVKTEIVNNTDIYRLDVNRLASGMYFVNIQSGNRMATKRLVIQQ